MKFVFQQPQVTLCCSNCIPSVCDVQVTVIGDGSQPPTVIAGDKLNDKDTLIKLGKEAVLPQAIGKVGDALSDKVFR